MRFLFILLSFCFLVGCSKERPSEVSCCTTNRTWASLSGEDIIVRVDDKTMTKADAEGEADLLMAMFVMVNPTANETVKEQFKRSRLPKIIGSFINRQLFLGAARQAKIEPTAEDFEAITTEYRISMGGIGTNKFHRFVEKMNAANKSVYEREMRESATINAYWRQKHPSLYNVSEQDLKNVQKEVDEMRTEAEKLTVESWKKAKEALSRAEKESFEVVADELSAVKREDDVLWGEIVPHEIESLYPDLAEAVAKLEPGQITGIIEQDDGLHIVKLFNRKGSGVVSLVNNDPETLTVGHIVVQLPYEYKMAPVEQVVDETRRLRLASEKKKLAKDLRKSVRVEFPSGTNFWPKVANSRAKGVK